MRSWWLALGAGLVVVVAVNWQAIAFGLIVAFSGPGAPEPRLIEGVELSWTDESFPAFLAETFPVGTSISDLVARLEADGFEVGPGDHASRDWGPSWCRWVMYIDWSEEDGRLTELTGRYGPICP